MSLSEIAPRPARPALEAPPAVAATFPAVGPRLALAAATGLVLDTFRQAAASRLMLLALCLGALGVLTCLSVRVEGPRTLKPAGEIELLDAKERPMTGPGAPLGRMTVGFGLASVGNFRDAESQVRFLQALLARWAAGVAGTLLLLASTAGFLPEFLRPGSASILLAKPAPRWALLAGKVIGVLAFVAAMTGGFILGTWLALGARTGVWAPGYLLAWPVVVAQFAGLYAASVVAATCTRNASASLFAALACWLICAGVNGSRDAIRAQPSPACPPGDSIGDRGRLLGPAQAGRPVPDARPGGRGVGPLRRLGRAGRGCHRRGAGRRGRLVARLRRRDAGRRGPAALHDRLLRIGGMVGG